MMVVIRKDIATITQLQLSPPMCNLAKPIPQKHATIYQNAGTISKNEFRQTPTSISTPTSLFAKCSSTMGPGNLPTRSPPSAPLPPCSPNARPPWAREICPRAHLHQHPYLPVRQMLVHHGPGKSAHALTSISTPTSLFAKCSSTMGSGNLPTRSWINRNCPFGLAGSFATT